MKHFFVCLFSLSVVQGREAFVAPSIRRDSSISKILSFRKNILPRSSAPTDLRGGSSGATPNMSSVSFDNGPLLLNTNIIVGINFLGYLLSLVFDAHYHVDLLGTGAFGLAALPSLLDKSLPRRIHWSATAVITWSAKLALFLFSRVIGKRYDDRLREILASPYYAAGFWIVSALWGVICSLPHSVGATSSAPGTPWSLRVGTGIFCLGFLTETTADFQKWAFKKDPAHRGKFCNAGLWSISQHPNWFGNILLWTGIFVMNAPALVEPVSLKATLWQKIWSYRRVGLALLGPWFMWSLFSRQATGQMLEDSFKANRERYGYGKNPAYTKYVDETPLIVPNPLKWFKLEFFSTVHSRSR